MSQTTVASARTRASRAAILGVGAAALSVLVSGCGSTYKAGDAGCVGYTSGDSYVGCMQGRHRQQQLASDRLRQQQAGTAQNHGS